MAKKLLGNGSIHAPQTASIKARDEARVVQGNSGTADGFYRTSGHRRPGRPDRGRSGTVVPVVLQVFQSLVPSRPLFAGMIAKDEAVVTSAPEGWAASSKG